MRQNVGARYSFVCTVALVMMGATVLFSCKEMIQKTDAIGQTDSLSTLTIHEMRAVQTEYGRVRSRLEAPLMENYSLLPQPYEIFPKGIKVTGYTPEGVLETEITAQRAIHKMGSNERWEAYGNVVIINFIKEQRVETDTLYWDRPSRKIYTHALVRYYDPDAFIQGIGMESDDRASNIVVLKPFDSYVVVRDTTTRAPEVTID